MTDTTSKDATGPDPAVEQEELHAARPHHKDKSKVVTTAFGEKISGGIADISDGDE